MANIQPKPGANIYEGLRLSFNAAMKRNLFRKHNGAKYHDEKLEAEDKLDRWFKANLQGLPEEPEQVDNIEN
jgi:hypothetical protein